MKNVHCPSASESIKFPQKIRDYWFTIKFSWRYATLKLAPSVSAASVEYKYWGDLVAQVHSPPPSSPLRPLGSATAAKSNTTRTLVIKVAILNSVEISKGVHVIRNTPFEGILTSSTI